MKIKLSEAEAYTVLGMGEQLTSEGIATARDYALLMKLKQKLNLENTDLDEVEYD